MRLTRPSQHLTHAAVALATLVTLSACATSTAEDPADHSSPAESNQIDPESAWNEQLIDGPTKPEDLIQVDTGAVIVSGMSADPGSDAGGAGNLYTLDPATREVSEAWSQAGPEVAHDRERFGECPGPPDTASLSPHGLATEQNSDGTQYLHVVNHGGRESIETYAVAGDDADGTALTWVGCSVLPDGSFGNGVVEDPNSHGYYVTHFLDPADMKSQFEKAFAGETTGHVLHWTPDSGWRQVPGSRMSTPNGIATSDDGRSLYVASWGGRELVEMDAETGERTDSVPLELMADNLRRTDDGRFLVTGQVIDSAETFMEYEFGDRKPEERYDVYAFTPDSFTVEPVALGNVPNFGNPTTALPVEGSLLVGSVAGDKILQLDPA